MKIYLKEPLPDKNKIEEDLKSQTHDEDASDYHVGHVQKEVAVVVVSNTVVQPETTTLRFNEAKQFINQETSGFFRLFSKFK